MNDKPEGKLARGRIKQKKEPEPRRVVHFDGLVDLALDGDKVVFLILGDDGLEMATSK